MGGWVVIIKLKADLSSTGTGLPTGTELGNHSFRESVKSREITPNSTIAKSSEALSYNLRDRSH